MRLAAALLILAAVVVSPTLGQQGEGPDEMREANRAASLLLKERLRRDRPADYRRFCRIRQRDLLVVRGVYDRVELVLAEIGVPFAQVEPEQLARTNLKGYRVVLVNCPGRVGEAGVAKLAAHVRSGGLLFTTDWSVLHILEPAFPETVRYTRKPTRNDVVKIRVFRPEHLFLKDVLTGQDHHLWWLENQSYPFRILNPRRVEVLIDSEEMLKKYGAKPIAVTFPAGRGRVVHVVSHFYLQRSELRGKRDRLPAEAFAGDLGFAPGSGAVQELRREGLAAVPSGRLRSAYSAQQFLANILIEAIPPREPDPEPPVIRPEPPRPGGKRVTAAKATVLAERPEGAAVRAIPEGLRLTVVEERGNWLRVRTPAGVEGWLPRSSVRD